MKLKKKIVRKKPRKRKKKVKVGVGQGVGGGRPKAFKTVKELEELIVAYFKSCDENTTEKWLFDGGKHFKAEVKAPIPYTVEGLAVALGVDRHTILNYEEEPKNKKFFTTIKRAKQLILGQKVQKGLMNETNPAITIFDLKNNYGYIDKQHVDQTNREGKPIDPLDKEKMLDV